MYDRGFGDRLATKKKENEVLHKNTLAYKQQMHEKQRDFEANLKDQQTKQKPFDAKINQMSLANATKSKLDKQANEETMEFIIESHRMGGENFDAYESQAQSGFDLMDGHQDAHDDIAAKMRLESV